MSTSASGVQKPERFELYVEKLRSVCEMHNIPTGSPDHLSGFITRLDDDRRFGMDFWALVGKLSSREGGELNDNQTLAVVVAGITSQLPDETDDRLRPQINHLQTLLSGVDIQRPESQLPETQSQDPQRPEPDRPDPPIPARSNAAVPIDHRRRRFSIAPEDAQPALETQMLQTIQRLEAINRQLKESLISIDKRINVLEARLTEYPADTFFREEPAPPLSKKTPPAAPPTAVPPVAPRRVMNPPVDASPAAAPPPTHRAPFAHRPRIEEPSRPIHEPISEPVREPIKPILQSQPNIAQASPALSRQTAPSIEQPAPSATAHPTPAIETPAKAKEQQIVSTAPVPETRAPLTAPRAGTPVQRPHTAETKAEKAPAPKTEVESEISTQSWKTDAKPLRTTSKQRLVLDPIAQPAPSSESSARKVSKSHTRPLFAGYESSSSASGKKAIAGVAVAVLLAGSGYAWHRYSTTLTQLMHPGANVSSTQSAAQPATPADDSTSQTAQPQSQADQSQPNQTQADPSASGQQSAPAPTDQPSADQATSTAATPQPETPAESPRKPALDRAGTKAAVAAEDLFANANWSAIKVPPEVMEKNLIVSRVPNYPDAAKASRVKGTVIVQALIQKDGSVGRVRVLQGDSRLRNAAMDAIFRQKYRPYTVNGSAVDVITTISLDFAPPQ